MLSLCTLGLYDFYWAYQNWRRVKEQGTEDLSPFWRAFWAPFWCFSTFGRIRTLTIVISGLIFILAVSETLFPSV